MSRAYRANERADGEQVAVAVCQQNMRRRARGSGILVETIDWCEFQILFVASDEVDFPIGKREVYCRILRNNVAYSEHWGKNGLGERPVHRSLAASVTRSQR